MKSVALLLFFLFSISCFVSKTKADHNRTQSIQAVGELLDNIEAKIRLAILEKKVSVNSSIAELHTDYQSAIQDHEAAIQVHTKAINDAEKDYAAALAVAEAEHEKDLEFAASKQELVEQAKQVMLHRQSLFESGKDSLDKELSVFLHNLESELALIERIRDLLGILHTRNIKAHGEPCGTDGFGCKPGLLCVENTCKSDILNSCSSTEDCAHENAVCDDVSLGRRCVLQQLDTLSSYYGLYTRQM